MKKLKIKVIKSNFVLNWYHNQIGSVFEVAEVDKKDRDVLVFRGPSIVSPVNFDDCEIIDDTNL